MRYRAFELNYEFNLKVSYKNNTNFHSKSKAISELTNKLLDLTIICKKNFYYSKKL